jgi:hypothetical protein
MVLREMGFEGVDWIHLAQDKGRWRTLVNMEIKKLTFGLHKLWGISGPAERIISFSSNPMEFVKNSVAVNTYLAFYFNC